MNVSLNLRQAAYASETPRVPIFLMTIEHDTLPEPLRISSDPTQRIEELTTDFEVAYGTVSRGDTYIFFPVRLKLPDDADEGSGTMEIEIDNVHRTLTETIRNIFTPCVFKTEIVMDNTLDVVEVSWPEFELINISYNASVISGTLKAETLEREPFPSGKFCPSYFPGLFI